LNQLYISVSVGLTPIGLCWVGFSRAEWN